MKFSFFSLVFLFGVLSTPLDPVLAQDILSVHPLGSWRSITSGFGYRMSPFNSWVREFHYGVDLRATRGEPVYAWRSGKVFRAGYDPLAGNRIVIEHSQGYVTKYHHLSDILVSPGTYVQTGEIIGRVGATGRATGAHLHFGLYRFNQPENPEPFLRKALSIQQFRQWQREQLAQTKENREGKRRGQLDTRTGYRVIQIHSDPEGAKIYVNGKFLGYTPLPIRFYFGHYLLRLERAGYREFTKTVEVHSDSPGEWTFRLERVSKRPWTRGQLTDLQKTVSSTERSNTSRRVRGPEAALLSVIPGMGHLYLRESNWYIYPLAMAGFYGLSLYAKNQKDTFYRQYLQATDPVAIDTLYERANWFYKMEQVSFKAIFVVWGLDILTAFIKGIRNIQVGQQVGFRQPEDDLRLALQYVQSVPTVRVTWEF